MSNGKTIADIIAEARDKYTVHDCTECNWRKCCLLAARGFGSAECLEKRESIALALGIEDGYFQGLLNRLEAAWKRESVTAAKLREGLVAIKALTALHEHEFSELGTVYRTAKAFLAEGGNK